MSNTISQAIEQSIRQTERVDAKFTGDQSALEAHIADNYANGNDAIFSRENDGTIDVHDIDGDWRICVTLIDEE